MEDFEKLEVIVRGKIADYNKRIKRAKGVTHSIVYLNDMESELKAFETILTKMREIKIGGLEVSDDVIKCRYPLQAK